MKEKISETLKSIGLSKNETKVYLDLIQNNQSSALEISKRTKIHRPNTYDALRTLSEKGFAQQIPNGNKRAFKALDPKKITDYILHKKQEVDSIIPHLVEFSKSSNHKEEITISKGLFALRNAILGLLECKDGICVYGIPQNSNEILGDGFLKDFHKRRLKEKIFMKHIYNQEANDRISELNRLKFTEAKHLAKKYDSHVTTNVCKDRVVIIIFSDPVSVIEIKSKDIAQTYLNYFDILWNHAKSS
jgi:sugar-specific transcriptional regulator TrmB